MSNTPDSPNSTIAIEHSAQTTAPPAPSGIAIGPGSILDNRYQIEKSIGKGGMGEIFLATDQKLQRQVAIKMMLSPESESDNKRFELESQTVASFKDPHTIRLFDYGITPEGFQYQVIEYLQGKNLKEHIRSHGPIHPTVAKSIGIQLCGSLAEAHRTNILHRDLKPSNIMLIDSPERGVQSKLLDFGLARAEHHDPTMTQTGTVLGSPMYMSPEQIEDKSTDLTPATDIYSLGLTLYTMLTGQSPFKGASISSILAAQLFQQPTALTEVQPSLQTEPGLCWIIETAIQKDKANRFESISQMKKALELSLQDPTGLLTLEDGELYFNEQAIQDYTSLSLQSISVSLDAASEQIGVETIQQSKPSSHPASVEEPTPKSMIGVGFAAILLIVAGAYWAIQPTPPPIPQPTQVTPVQVTPKPEMYTANISSSPEGATVTHGVETLGLTPLTREMAIEDTWEIVIQKDGFEPWKGSISKDAASMNVTLKAIVIPEIPKTTPVKSKTVSKPKIQKNTPVQKTAPSQNELKQVTNPFGAKK